MSSNWLMVCELWRIHEYFNILEDVLNELGLKGRPEKVWNLDESSFGNDPDKTKVVGARGFASTRTLHLAKITEEIPTLRVLTLRKVLQTINSSSQVTPKQITPNENNEVNIESNKTSKSQLTLLAASPKLQSFSLQSQGMGFSTLNDTNTPNSSNIKIIEDRILSDSEKVSFETLLLQKIKRCDSTVKLTKTKISKGCEVITREEFLEKKRKEEEDKEKTITVKKELKRKSTKKEKENNDPHCSKEAQLSDEIGNAKEKTDISLPKKKKTGKKSKKRVNKQKSIDWDEESECESDFSFDDLDRYREQCLAEIEDFGIFYKTGNENETGDFFSEHDANIVDEFEPDFGRRNPEVGGWILVRFTTKKSVNIS
ncbi:unnamed protein product [Pieris brassicae]|uniref:Uncharacterized protein n=1 Tax=Pieris brassicae TaxID=7116 RepID=A0A9P0XK47_PIEBR|nr:unnamed protein product [Pieris brassicae]